MRARLMLLTVFMLAATTARAQNPADRAQMDSAAANRAKLEQQVRERIAQVTRERLGATDDQMAKLQATNQKFDEQRRALVDQERQARIALRQAMGPRADAQQQAQIGALLDRVNGFQRQRMDIQEAEQHELSGYLSPIQRAKYFALEQQVRQRVNQMRQAQTQQDGGARAGRVGRGGQTRPLGRGKGVRPPPIPE